MADAMHVATHLFSGEAPAFSNFPPIFSNSADIGIALGAILILESVHFLQEKGSVRKMLAGKPLWITWGASYGAIFAILLFGVFRKTPFIYFQF